MIEFNEDGSLKLPEAYKKNKLDKENRMKNARCIKVKKEILSFDSPKKCLLRITLSEKMTDNRFINTIFNYFNQQSEVPAKISKINEKEFEVEIGTCFRRCTDCTSLIRRLREFLDGNLIEEKGECTFSTGRNFCYEDYFD